MINQLVTIQFEQEDRHKSVHWYHVPRVGDWVSLWWEDVAFEGDIYAVTWYIDHVLVRVK